MVADLFMKNSIWIYFLGVKLLMTVYKYVTYICNLLIMSKNCIYWTTYIIRNLEPNCEYSVPRFLPKSLHRSCTLARNSEIKKIEYISWHWKYQQSTNICLSSLRYRTLHPPQNICRPLKTFACVSLRYRKRCGGGWMAILVVVCGKICGKMCGKIEKLSDWNKNLCGSIYGPRDYDSSDKKTKKMW